MICDLHLYSLLLAKQTTFRLLNHDFLTMNHSKLYIHDFQSWLVSVPKIGMQIGAWVQIVASIAH